MLRRLRTSAATARHLTCLTGIGNPEPAYASTRHNVGLIILDMLKNRFETEQAHPYKISSISSAKYCQISPQLLLIRSDGNYVNLSGKTVAPLWNKLPHRDQVTHIVIHDELSLPLGKVQLRKPGVSLRGHNGLRNVQACWKKNDFYKLSIGIGRPSERDSSVVSKYVLSKFTNQELEILKVRTLPSAWEKVSHLL